VIALFEREVLTNCASADADGSGVVTAGDLVGAVTNRIAGPASCPAPHSTWIPLAALAGGPRQEVGVAAIGHTIYVIGGCAASGRGGSRVEAYDVTTNTWSAVADLPAARNHGGAAAADGAVYSIGGFANSSFTPAAEVFRYDPSSDRWSGVAPLPTARG